MKIILVCLAVFVVGCRSADIQKKTAVPQKQEEITLEQRYYLRIYETFRIMGVKHFNARANATAEQMLPEIAMLLGLPLNSTAKKVLEHPKVVRILTDERRRKVAAVFNLPEDTTWIEINALAERLRKKEIGESSYVQSR